MEYSTMKSKWESQQIQKRCKNRHHNGLYAAWRKCSNFNPSYSWKKFCNEYKKEIYAKRNENTFEKYESNLYQTRYWRCSLCTFDNMQCDLYCAICKSPFKTSNTTRKQHITTLSHYLPSQYTDTMYHQDDFDESIQIAIILSYNEPNPIQTESEDSDDDDIYVEHQYTDDTSTDPLYNACYKYKSIKTKNRKQYNMASDDDPYEIQIKNKKQWCIHKTAAGKLKKLRRARYTKENKSLRNKHRKCLKAFPQLAAFINKSKIKCIKQDIADSYSDDKQIDIRCILNHSLLHRFGFAKHSLKIVYHGTNYRNNKSIMENGLISGGTKGVGVRNGSAHGKGVYCSPDTSTARWYENGSMFVCVVKGNTVKRFGSIWVVPDDTDILPLFVASFDEKSRISLPQNTINLTDGGWSQKIIRFIPSFASLNQKNTINRKIKRKWNAYFKINQFVE